ncbi:MAG: sugar phosphate nucleotidyltransferase [bacterium]|nr:sugar phosphate nucleotidyltransferase [bacterium]
MAPILKDCYVIILAGGGGTRLWPKSRTRKPKQFLKISGKNTLFVETIRRVTPIVPPENIFVVTNENYSNEVQNEAPDLPPENILVEPEAKGTAAAIGLAVIHIHKRNPHAVIASLASDHLVKKTNEFHQVLATAFEAAKKDSFLVTVGIYPTHADTGLGYIHVAKKLLEIDKKPVFTVESFTEKPDLPTAEAFLATKEYFWNASYFVGKAAVFLEAFKAHMPKLYLGLMEVDSKINSDKEMEATKIVWQKLDDIPIDYGIMEKAKNLVMVPADIGWSDIGNWAVLHEVLKSSSEDNVVIGDEEGKHLSLGTKGCLIHSNGRLIATIGLSDMVIVDTLDALLICPKDKVQEVKKIVEMLKKEKRHEHL